MPCVPRVIYPFRVSTAPNHRPQISYKAALDHVSDLQQPGDSVVDRSLSSSGEYSSPPAFAMPGSKNMIVAFGHNDKQFFIAAGRSTESHRLPTSMHNQIVGELRTPIEFASWGTGEPGHVKYFLSGYAPANANTRRSRWHIGDTPVATALYDACKSGGKHYPKGVSFGKNGAYAWWSDSVCHYGKLGDLRLSWVKKMKLEYPRKRIAKLFLGSGSGAVIVWDDQTFAYQGLNHRLATVLTDARKKGLHPRHVAMGLFNSEWFFVQFSDMSITWYAPKELSDHLKDHAKALGVELYKHTT